MVYLKNFFFGDAISGIITFVGCILFCCVLLKVAVTFFIQSTPSQTKIAWAQFDNGSSRSGVNARETVLTPANVSSLKRLWQTSLPNARSNGSPVEIPSVTTSSGIKDILFVTTQAGSLFALDAATGATLWRRDTTGNFVGGQGTSSSPAIDPTGQFIYSYGLDGKVHKYAVGNGNEDMTKGFPVSVTVSTDVEKISSPLTIANGYLYVSTNGYDGDFGQYVGHVVAVNLTSGTTTVFNSLCANIKQLSPAGFCHDKGSGIWGRSGVVVDPVTNDVFIVTGNGNYNASMGGNNYGDSVIELSPDLSKILDSYTPTTFSQLDSGDDDLGSTGVTILPMQQGSATPYLGVLGSKDQIVRLVNRQNLSGKNGPNNVGGELQALHVSCQVLSHSVAWIDTSGTSWVFVTDMCANLYAYKVVTTNTNTSLNLVYQKGNVGKNSPVVAGNVLYVPGSKNLSAIDPTTGNVLWSSAQPSAGGNIGSLHWQSQIVVNGVVFIPDDTGSITAYAPTDNLSPTGVTVSPTQGSVVFSLTICPHGLGNCGDNVNPNGGGNIAIKHVQRSVNLALLDNNAKQVSSATGTVSYNQSTQNFQGTVTLSNLSPGQYLAQVKMDEFLSKQVPGIITISSSSQTITLPEISVVSGDVNNDNQLDISDYNDIISCFGSKQTSSSCSYPITVKSPGADINDDGVVDGVDYNIFLRELSVLHG